MNEIMIDALDTVAHFHSQRLARGTSYGRRDGLEPSPETTADLLAEWTGWRQRRTFGDELQTWLAAEYGLEPELHKVLMEWLSAQPLPITRIETSLADAGLDLEALSTAHGAILTHAHLDGAELPAGETVAKATLIATSSAIDDALNPALAVWLDFYRGLFQAVLQRAAKAAADSRAGSGAIAG